MNNLSVSTNYLCLSTRGSNYKIPIDTILYIESNNRILTIHTLSETYLRCHQSYLVAINQIIGYNNQSITLRDTDTAIPVSRQYQKKTRDFLKNQPSCGTLICTCGIYEGSMIRIKAEQRVLIGRDGNVVDVVINLPLVSRIHCEITYHKKEQKYEIIDYSSNGTFIEGNTRLIPKQVYLLNPETELSLGDFSTTYKLL